MRLSPNQISLRVTACLQTGFALVLLLPMLEVYDILSRDLVVSVLFATPKVFTCPFISIQLYVLRAIHLPTFSPIFRPTSP